MRCHNCEIDLEWDGFQPIIVCEVCHSIRFVDVPDESGDCIIPLDRRGGFHCPCCRRRLVEAAMDGLRVEHCIECDGVLMNNDVFTMFVRNRRSEFRDAALQPVILLTEQQGQDIHCPCCRRTMNIHPCYGPGYIIVNSCNGCGMVWLDCRERESSLSDLAIQ